MEPRTVAKRLSDYLSEKGYPSDMTKFKQDIIGKYGTYLPLRQRHGIPSSHLTDLFAGRKKFLKPWMEKIYNDIYG